jgi:uncharacterized protein (DUF2141 family)
MSILHVSMEGERGMILTPGPEETRNRRISFRLDGIPAGMYGIRCFQDENGNAKLDMAR